jgi:hypothetical protein
MLQGGTLQRRSLLTPLGGTPTAIMRSYHLTLMFPCLPHPRYPTSLRCQDRSHHDHRLRCYHRQSLCRPQLVPPNHKFCNPPLCRVLRKNLQAQFLRSPLAPRLWNSQNLFVFVSHLTRLCRLLLLLHLSLPGRLGHANKRCLRLLPRQKRAGAEQFLMLFPHRQFLRFHLPPASATAAPTPGPAASLRPQRERRPAPMTTDTPSAVRHAKFTYIDYNRQVRASLNQNPVERKQIFLLFIALLAAQ